MADFDDLTAYARHPRVTSLALSPDGSRLVAGVDHVDDEDATYRSALWEIDPAGARPPVRLTWSAAGESSPAFLADGSLLFVSARPGASSGSGDASLVASEAGAGGSPGDEAALWCLPAGREATVWARSPGGLGSPVVAAGGGTVVVRASRPLGVDDDGAEWRRTRRDRKVTGILHTGMPIRWWDHELDEVAPRLLAVVDGDEPVDVTPGATHELTEASYDISADGRTVVTTWDRRRRHGRVQRQVAVLDVPAGSRRLLPLDPEADLARPRLSPDGRRVAVRRETEGDFETVLTAALEFHDLEAPTAAPVAAGLGDLWITEHAWAVDGSVLYVSGDWRGRGAVVAVDPADGRVVRRLASDAVYSALSPAPDGVHLYALRTAYDVPPEPVRLDVTAEDQVPHRLASPAPAPVLPGTLEEVAATARDGATVRAWLCLPPPGDQPAPVMLWVHGGPFSSWNAWSWRWNPWVPVAHGYAVLLPDPALSTGYGPAWFERAWPHRAAEVWADLEAVLDAALERDDLDAGRTACLGGSFGGYMTNWIAGHTDRFDAIVTHAGLWALDQQHATTDAAAWKTGVFGTREERPAWYAANSPDNFIDHIRTPMLVVHGNRDYRVPVSEALRLWWDLVSHFDGDPENLPHRFLQFTGENHWVLSPANTEVWYDTVLGFCDQHLRGRPPRRSPLL